MAKKKSSKEDITGMFIPAGAVFGMGIGFLTGDLVAYLFMGLGAGFALFALSSLWSSK